MRIHQDFTGGNITVLEITGGTVKLENQLRETEGDWFYWAFCVEGAQGETLTFGFGKKNWVGYFGPAVSRDLTSWAWQRPENTGNRTGSEFTYTFGPEESRVYFAHSMLYHPGRFAAFARARNLPLRRLALSQAGRAVEIAQFGGGKRTILLTARHHACESTGSYVLEGALAQLLEHPPAGCTVAAVPFVDLDGVVSGDQGKNRRPHDHNRDYLPDPVYPATAAIMDYVNGRDIAFALDFHSPWHAGNGDDKAFTVRCGHDNAPYDAFGAALERETAACPQALRYHMGGDIGNNARWNQDCTPSCSRYILRRPGVKLSASFETPYFGTSQNQANEQSMLHLGRCIARCISCL